MGSIAVGPIIRRRSGDRVQQEIILGIGGVRALRTLGCHPTVWHLNEGHAGFVVLQRIREFVDQGLSFDDALEEVRRTHRVHDAHARFGRTTRSTFSSSRSTSRARGARSARIGRSSRSVSTTTGAAPSST